MKHCLNPLEEFIKEYFSRLNLINGYLFQVVNRMKSHVKRLTDFYSENGIDINSLFAGTSLVFSDLSEWPDDGWRKNYASGGFSVKGEDYLAFTEVLIQRESALSIALAYEALEVFLKRVCSKFILLNQEFINKEKYQKFLERYAECSTMELDYWFEYLKLSYKGKNNKYLLKFIREASPRFEKLEIDNNRNLNLVDWMEVTSIVRHSIIHSNSVIKGEEVNKLTSGQKEVLKQYFPGESDKNGYAVKFDEKSANKQLVSLAEYGFLIFQCLSISGKYEWDIFEMKKN